MESDDDFTKELTQSTQESCPFCPERLERYAPKFPPEIAPEGRIKLNEAICFPSLFAHDYFNAIVVPTQKHELRLNEFSVPMLLDAFGACVKYFDRVRAFSSEIRYPTIVMNFLPPAGSTIAHAHIQALSSDMPLQTATEWFRASREYELKNGVNYWSDLVETEKRIRLRYLADFSNVHWLIPFAPLGLNEAQAVVSDHSNFDHLTTENWRGISEGIVRVLQYYNDIGVRSFNVAIYSGPLGEDERAFRVNARIVSRYGYKLKFVSDVWALQYLLGTQEVFETPEETCIELAKHFRN
jgi:galactose-1-phosphate uridylyltransferase